MRRVWSRMISCLVVTAMVITSNCIPTMADTLLDKSSETTEFIENDNELVLDDLEPSADLHENDENFINENIDSNFDSNNTDCGAGGSIISEEHRDDYLTTTNVGSPNIDISVNDFANERTSNTLEGMIGDIFSSKYEEEIGTGYNIFSVVVKDNIATVEYHATENATLLVAIYTEDGSRMLAFGKDKITSSDKSKEIIIDSSAMPEYFYLKAYILGDNLEPLCEVYESPNYTKEMREFFSKTTDDFEKDRVLNLDKDKTTNFLVFNEDTIRIKEGINKCTLVSSDENELLYVFSDPEKELSNIREGGLISYEYKNGNIIVIAVSNIKIEDDKVQISGKAESLEEVFDYVRIERDTADDDVIVELEKNNTNDSMAFNSLDNSVESPQINEDSLANKDEIEYDEASGEISVKYDFVDTKIEDGQGGAVKINGSVDFNTKISTKLYLSLTYSYVELKLEYKIKGSISIEGKITAKIPLRSMPIGVALCPGIYVKFTPSFVIEASAKASISFTITGKAGFEKETNEKINWYDTYPDFKAEPKGEVKIFIGVSLQPELVLLSEKILDVSFEALAGGELKGTLISKKDNGTYLHLCSKCIDGDLFAKGEIKCSIKIFNLDKWKIEGKIGFYDKLSNWYYSSDYNEFAWSTCPHMAYKAEFLIKTKNGDPISNAAISVPEGFLYTENDAIRKKNTIKTDNSGKISGYLPNGEYVVSVSSEGYKTTNRVIKIENDSLREEIVLEKKANDNVSITDISATSINNCAIDENGNLWYWGWGDMSEGGMEGEPVKNPIIILTDVVYTDNRCAIKSDGTLWDLVSDSRVKDKNGYSYYGSMPKPKKVAENVKYCEGINGYGLTTLMIKEDGSLWMKGDNYHGQLGNGTQEDSDTYVKVMDDVVIAHESLDTVMAIKKDGSLWSWGSNEWGKLGKGTSEANEKFSASPVKVLENVKDVEIDFYSVIALKKDGSLWTWGSNGFGEESWNYGYGYLGNGKTTNSYYPTRILSNVKEICCNYDENYRGVIKNDNTLWMWGPKHSATYDDDLSPVKIMDDVMYACTGFYNTFYIKNDNSLWVRKANFLDENYDKYNFQTLKNLDNVKKIFSPDDHCLALGTDGTVWAWGDNSILGEEDFYSLTPERVVFNTANNYVSDLNGYSMYYQNYADSGEKNVNYGQIQYGVPMDVASFHGLCGAEIYNIYIIKKFDIEDVLSKDNLQFLTQVISDDLGNINLTFIPKDAIGNLTAIAVKRPNGETNKKDWGDLESLPDIRKLFNNAEDIPSGAWYAFEGDDKYYLPSTSPQLIQVSKDYTGKKIIFNKEVLVFYGNKRLVEGRDYSIKYSNNMNPSDASLDTTSPSIIIKGIGSFYKGSSIFRFTIAGTDAVIPKVKVVCKNTSPEYTGKPISFEDLKISLIDETDGKNTVLKEGTDYTFDKSQLRSVGTFTLRFKLSDSRGTVVSDPITVKRYNVKKHIKSGDSKIDIKVAESADYCKAGATTEVTVKFDGEKLREGVDYKVTFRNNRKVSKKAKAKITFMGYFSGSITEYFEIVKKNVSSLEVYAEDLKWKDKPGNFVLLPKIMDGGKALSKNSDIAKYSKADCLYYYAEGDKKGQRLYADDTVPAGTIVEVRVKVTGKDKAYTGEATLSGRYCVYGAEKSIKKATVNKNPIDYNEGQAIIPEYMKDFTLTMLGDTQPLDQKYFEIESVTKNRFIGSASVIVRGKNGYGGTKKFTIKIVKRRL